MRVALVSIALLACGKRSQTHDDARVAPVVRDAPVEAGFAVYGVSPTLGPVNQWVYVEGYFFTRDAKVELGGVAATNVAFYDIDQLGFAVPEGASGTSPVVVTIGTTRVTSRNQFTVGIPHDRPSITSFDPREGAPGAWIVIEGANFVGGDTLVVLGDHVVKAHVYGPEQLGFNVPDGVAGDIQLVVRTPNGDAHAEGRFRVTTDRRSVPVR